MLKIIWVAIILGIIVLVTQPILIFLGLFLLAGAEIWVGLKKRLF